MARFGGRAIRGRGLVSRRERNEIDQADAAFWRGLVLAILLSLGIWLLVWVVARLMGLIS
jgi:Na+-driven multidrug efflux pump